VGGGPGWRISYIGISDKGLFKRHQPISDYIGRSFTSAERMNFFTRDDQPGNGLSNVLLLAGLLLVGFFRIAQGVEFNWFQSPIWLLNLFHNLSTQAFWVLYVLCLGLIAVGGWIRNW